MDQKLIDLLKTSISQIQSNILKVISSCKDGASFSFEERRLVSESLISIFEVIQSESTSTEDKIILSRTFRKGHDLLYGRILHYNDFYYTYHALRDNDLDKQQDQLKRANVAVASMNCHIRAFMLSIDKIGGSTDEYFFSRMPNVFNGVAKALLHNKDNIYIPISYLLLNLHNVLRTYEISNHEKFNKLVTLLINQSEDLIHQLFDKTEIQDYVSRNKQLLYFYYSQFSKDYSSDPDDLLSKNILEARTENSLRILQSISEINKNQYARLFESLVLKLAENYKWDLMAFALYTRLFCRYAVHVDFTRQLDLNLKEPFQELHLTDRLAEIFNGYNKIDSVSLDSGELELLLKYNDQELRDRVTRIILNVPSQVISRESKKPHGVFEISDMELQIKIADFRFYLCMPFKTGVEISSPTVPVDVAHQILRPFVFFDNCAVVFITAKRCSQPLMNYFKQFKDKWKLDIEVIENEELAKILKYNGELN